MDLRDEVANALYWDLAVPDYRLTIRIDSGLVTLSGDVDWEYQRECAEADVRRVPGVTGVENRIGVRGAQESGQRPAA